MIKIIVAGACGRMARRILTLASQSKDFEITGAFERKDHPEVGKSLGKLLGLEGIKIPISGNIGEIIEKGEVIIDFTTPEASAYHLEQASRFKKAMVIGTTGLSQETLSKIKEASKKIPLVQAPNMSIGVNLLFKLANLVGKTLGEEYDVEITEIHHRHKKDAPSGTALELASQIAQARGGSLDKLAIYGRKGLGPERKKGTVGIHSLRGGDVVGEHTVSFFTEGERVELVHKASSRDAFAQGALLAAKFVAQKKNGFFSMQDVLGLK